MKKRSRSTKKKDRRKKHHKEGTPDEIILEADEAMESLDLSKGVKLYKTASNMLRGRLDMKLESTECRSETVMQLAKVMGKLGEAKVSMGDPDGARQDFASAIVLLDSISPGENVPDLALLQLHESRASLHLFFGQLSSNEEALKAYKTGIQQLESCVALREALCNQSSRNGKDQMKDGTSRVQEEQALVETQKQLCGAYCSVAELYLTDLCFGENAEEDCESHLQSALKVTDPVDGQPLVDALQTTASLRISQSRGTEAVDNVLAVYDKIKTGCEALAALVGLGGDGLEGDNELLEVEAANNLPGFEFRVQTSKLLLECSSILKSSQDPNDYNNETTQHQQKRCVLASIQVLGSLIAENDEVVEIWYLLGCAFAALDPPNAEVACQYWERAKEMLLNVKESLEEEVTEMDEVDDSGATQQLQNVLDQLEEVNRMLIEFGSKAESMDEA